MCSNLFNSSIKTLIISLWMFGSLVLLDSAGSTTPSNEQCHDDAAVVCKNTGGGDHRNALTSAFSGNHEIDLIFIVCNTTECAQVYGAVITFIQSLVALVSTKYESYIDTKRLHVAVVVYDNTSVRVTLNDIEKTTPKVGNCEFDKFLSNRMDSSEARGERYDGLLKEGLTKAKEVFSQTARTNAKKILWLFSECGYCESSVKRQGVEAAVGDIKNGYGNNVIVFTAGISQCPIGWFATLAQEDTMKTIASTRSSHYACIDSWFNITNAEINSGTNSQPWSEISKDVDIGGSCRECANSTSSYRCGCQVSSKEYMCHEFPIDPSTLAIALGAGIGGGLFVIIIIVIIVVVARRCKGPRTPPPPLPRTRIQLRPPASPPKDPVYDNTENVLVEDDVEYEVMELEQNMTGWSAHLLQLKRENPVILHLGIYSSDGEYFAQTPGFTLTHSQTTALDDAMTNGNSGGKSRKKSDVTVGGTTYVIEQKSREKLSAQTKDKTTRLGVVFRAGYLAVGVAEAKGRDRCDELIAEVLGAVSP